MRVSADSVSVWTNRNGQNWVTARVKVRWWCYGSFSRGWISPRTKSKQYANTETDTVDSGRNLPPPAMALLAGLFFGRVTQTSLIKTLRLLDRTFHRRYTMPKPPDNRVKSKHKTALRTILLSPLNLLL